MGTHPIFESDFDCLTDMRFTSLVSNLKSNKWRESTLRQNYKKDTFISHASETHSGAVGWEKRSMPNRPVQTPHLNGATRFIPQLCRLVFRVSPFGSESAPLRRVIDHELEHFAEENKSTVIYIRSEDFDEPSVSAEWLNGEIQVYPLDKLSEEYIIDTLNVLSWQSGIAHHEWRTKSVSTQKPSIQGYSIPFEKNKNIKKLPKLKLGDAWENEKLNDKYYRENEIWKINAKPFVDGPDRKNNPLGPFPTIKDLPK